MGRLPHVTMRRVLIANRGEIAIRIARACHAQGLAAVAVYSDADREAPHVLAADDAVGIGPAPARESYLRMDALIEAARRAKADAVHPGYGFLAENAGFARAVVDAGLTWIGPAPETIAAMGDKITARATADRAGVPLVPGAEVGAGDGAEAGRRAGALGYPVLVKAAGGGGGKGMRAVARPEELADALAAAGREAESAFGDARVYLEKLLERPRHVEVQVLGDGRGGLLHLGERECSIQRRHQKLVEETPCPIMTARLRADMTEAALAVACAVGYASAGTVEFLLDGSGRFYFLEMNTRLQVEHPVTELITGIDLVAAQLRIARGEPVGLSQSDVTFRGHAMEVRVCAENPAAGFLPSAGTVVALSEPAGPGVRVDSGIAAGTSVPLEYDSLLARSRPGDPIAAPQSTDCTRPCARRSCSARPPTSPSSKTCSPIRPSARARRTPAFSTSTCRAGDRTRARSPQPPSRPRWVCARRPVPWRRPPRVWRARHRRGRRSAAGGSAPDGMETRLRQGERTISVELADPLDGRATVDGHPHEVRQLAIRPVRTADGGTGVELALTIDGGGRRAVVVRQGDRVLVAVDGRAHAFGLGEAPRRASAAAGASVVVAPMPGKVVRVLVSAGDRVETGQALVVLEAMKMETMLRAEIAGTVSAIGAEPGVMVDAGVVLVELAPPPS